MKKLIAILVILSAMNASGQWVQMNGPHGGNIKCTAVSGTNIFAAGGGYIDQVIMAQIGKPLIMDHTQVYTV